MPRFSPKVLILFMFIVIASLVYLSGVNSVPFHPDESTYIYMSSDFQTFFQQPSSVFWQPQPSNELRQHYRLLDPPLLRTWTGFIYWITGQPALASDWDWSKSWKANQAAGALPDPNLLQTGRMAVALFFPLTLLFIYHSGRELGNETAGWIAMIVSFTSTLILLHTRRVMAEGLLVAGVAFSVWALVAWQKRPWLTAIPIALAFNAKYSAVPLVLIGVIAIFWNPHTKSRTRREVILQLAVFLAIFVSLTWMLNPFLWAHPIQALTAAVTARSNFMVSQSADFAANGNWIVPQTIFQSLAAMLTQLFFAPPVFAEVANYLAQTQASEIFYLSNPVNWMIRGLVGGGFQLGFFLLGVITLIRGIFTTDRLEGKRLSILFLLTLFAEFVFLLLTTNVAFQRYYMVLLPLVILTISFGISSLIRFGRSIYAHYRRGVA